MPGIQNLPKRWSAIMQKYGISARSVAAQASVNMVIERNSVVVPDTYDFSTPPLSAGEHNEISGDTQQ